MVTVKQSARGKLALVLALAVPMLKIFRAQHQYRHARKARPPIRR